ncbi:NAD(P)H-binding protein [Streptomyces silvensis]|uniref:NAD(P)H-binding protein n=1 Tax=Streptomyces silvensis TaxID=1765722 RepID=UPI0007C7CD6B|nr:NAD(P)H-binding protein [Streptomyces silvensis]
MPDSPVVLVTGAGGNTGSRVTARLAGRGHAVRAASRAATVAHPGARPVRFDWYDEATHAPALDGADRVYLVPPPGDADPAAVVVPFLRRAHAAGVTRVVLLGSSAIERGGPGAGRVHQFLADEGLFDEWAVLRPSWFMQNFTADHAHARAIGTSGILTSATGTGRVAFVDADDIAAVAVHALTAAAAPERELVITGPEALSFDEVAATVARLTGRPVEHRPVTAERLAAHLAELGVPADFARILAALDTAIAGGAEDRVTDTVERLTGRPPRAFADFYRAARSGADSSRGARSGSTVTVPSR